MDIPTSLVPKFVVFHYLIKWFIENLGIIPYFLGFIGPIGGFCIYAFIRSYRSGEWDRAIMIIIFMLIIVGGLIGLGIDIRNGYPIHTFEYQ